MAIDSLKKYSFVFKRNRFDVFRGAEQITEGVIYSIDMDNYYLRRAKQLDSTDIARGFILARALGGPAVAEPPDCASVYSIDSLHEYRNQFDVRCFFIRIKGITFCESARPDTSFFRGYYVDISQDSIYRFVEIPHGLFIDDKTIAEASRFLANHINVP